MKISMEQGKYLKQRIKDINTGMGLAKKIHPATIYCGDEDRAEFLILALEELGINTDQCETFTVDGEYHVEVKI